MRLGLQQLGRTTSRGPQRVRQVGRVLQVVGTIIEAELPGVAVGAIADIGRTQTEVVGFRENRALLMPLAPKGISHGDAVRVRGTSLTLTPRPGLLGRVIDPLGVPLDGEPLRDCSGRRSLHSTILRRRWHGSNTRRFPRPDPGHRRCSDAR